MKKKILLCFCLLAIVISFTSCRRDKFEIVIESPLEFYTPVISSVPGFPLRVIVPDDSYIGGYLFKWKTDIGKFIDWEDDGRVISLGKQALVTENEIFWTPLDGSEFEKGDANLEIQMIRADGGTVDSRAKFTITVNDEGLYFLVTGN